MRLRLHSIFFSLRENLESRGGGAPSSTIFRRFACFFCRLWFCDVYALCDFFIFAAMLLPWPSFFFRGGGASLAVFFSSAAVVLPCDFRHALCFTTTHGVRRRFATPPWVLTATIFRFFSLPEKKKKNVRPWWWRRHREQGGIFLLLLIFLWCFLFDLFMRYCLHACFDWCRMNYAWRYNNSADATDLPRWDLFDSLFYLC